MLSFRIKTSSDVISKKVELFVKSWLEMIWKAAIAVCFDEMLQTFSRRDWKVLRKHVIVVSCLENGWHRHQCVPVLLVYLLFCVAMKAEGIWEWGAEEHTWAWNGRCKKESTELHNLCSSPNIIKVIISRRMRWPGHVALVEERRGVYRDLGVRLREGDHLEGLGVDGWVIVIWIFMKWKGMDGLDWSGFG